MERAPISRSQCVSLIAVLLLAALLRLVFIQGYVESDPAYYAGLANELAHGKFYVNDYDAALAFPLRVGVYAPVALLIKIFGLSENTIIIFPFIVSLAGCLLSYVLARALFGHRAGLVSAALVAILPADIAMASTLFPDMIAAFWANLGIAILFLDPNKNSDRHSLSLSILAGLCFGVSWLSKESVIYLAPFVLIYLYRRQSFFLHALCVGVPPALIIFIEGGFYWIATGDWLFHFHTIQRNYAQNAVWFFDESSPYFGWGHGEYYHAVLRRVLSRGPRDLLTAFCGLPILGLIAFAYGIAVKDRRLLHLGFWLVLLLAAFNFGSSSLSSYRPCPCISNGIFTQ